MLPDRASLRALYDQASALPGGEFPWYGIDDLRCDLARRNAFLSEADAYGTLASDLLGDARCTEDMGQCFGSGLTEREVDWLSRSEWARTTDD